MFTGGDQLGLQDRIQRHGIDDIARALGEDDP